MEKKLQGLTVKLYTKERCFYRGEVLDEDDTHIFLYDLKTKEEVMIAREWITQLTIEEVIE